SGDLARIQVDSLLIGSSSQRQPLAKLLQGLVSLMGQDWRESIPVGHLRIEKFRLALATGKEIGGELTLEKVDQRLSSVVALHTPEKPVLRFRQEEAGNWQLEASNSEENAFATMTFEHGRDYPLALQVDTDMARLRQWSLLFGIPFPAHNAHTIGLLRLKPDGDGQSADFELTGTASDIAEPQLEIARAETEITGNLAWNNDAQEVSVSASGELTMLALKKEHLDADRLDFRFDSSVTLTGDGLAGQFAPGLLINASAFTLEALATENARLVSQQPQSFSWNRRDSQWQLGQASYEIAAGTVDLGKTAIRNSNYQLEHDAWQYPYKGKTGFTIEGTSDAINVDALTLSGLAHKSAGSITWPANDAPLSMEIDLDISAAEVTSGALSANDLTVGGKVALVPGENFSITMAEGFAIKLGEMLFGEATLDAASLQLVQPQVMTIASEDNAPVMPGAGQLRFEHSGLSHPEFRLEPGVLELTMDETDASTGAITVQINAGAPVFIAAGTQWNTSEVEGRFMLAADALKLEGALVLDNTGSRITYELTHDPENNSGNLAFNSGDQPLQPLAESLRTLGAPLPAELQLLSGSASLAGQARWNGKLESLDTRISLKNSGGRLGKAWFSGLESDFDLALYPAISGESSRFGIQVIDLGIPITNLKGRISLETEKEKKPVITLSEIRAGMLDGSVRGNRVRIDLNRRSNSFTLAFSDISLAELVRLQQFEDIDAIGKLSGTLPITIGPAGLSISKGAASAKAPGGYIRYRPKNGGELFGSSSMETEMLLKALDDYQYEELDAAMAYKPDGQLTMQLQMKGRSPGLHATRPLHLNLNLDQNILSLIESLRAVDGLNDRIDRAVKEHFKARNR
ncbi:MAG: YdbH domain-containing protein, partial [Sedimenticolaceae bacterium]|nr:YdbH domain-containing protein [Sedimenticolaceae bacterium]